MVQKAFAVEDGNISRKTITAARSRVFKDIDLTFARRPDSDVYKKNDAAAVKQAVKNLLMTNIAEKPFNYNYGGNLNFIIFELFDDLTEYEISMRITKVIEIYEPRAIVEDIIVIKDLDRYNVAVSVRFRVVNYDEIETLDVTLTRLR